MEVIFVLGTGRLRLPGDRTRLRGLRVLQYSKSESRRGNSRHGTFPSARSERLGITWHRICCFVCWAPLTQDAIKLYFCIYTHMETQNRWTLNKVKSCHSHYLCPCDTSTWFPSSLACKCKGFYSCWTSFQLTLHNGEGAIYKKAKFSELERCLIRDCIYVSFIKGDLTRRRLLQLL